MQENQDEERSMDEVERVQENTHKNTGGGEIFSTRPARPWDHRASCKMGTGSLVRRQSDQGVALTTHFRD